MDVDRSIFLPSHHLFEGPFLKNVYYAKNAIFFKALQIRRMISTSLIFTLLIYSFWNYTSKIMWAKNIKWAMRGNWSKSQNPHWYCWSYFNTVKEPQGVLYKWDVRADTDIRLLKNPPKLQRQKKKNRLRKLNVLCWFKAVCEDTQHTIIDIVNDTKQIITKGTLIGFTMARSAPKYQCR